MMRGPARRAGLLRVGPVAGLTCGLALAALVIAGDAPARVRPDVTASAAPHAHAATGPKRPVSQLPSRVQELPAGSTEIPIEDLEGVVLVPALLHGSEGRDTSGWLVVDTGAGFLSLDAAVARDLGVADAESHPTGLELAPRALPRLELGSMQLDQLSPVLLIDARIIRAATGRDVLGLAGQSVFAGHALWIDYATERMVCVPSPPESLARAEATPGDGASPTGAARPGPSARIDTALVIRRAARSRHLLGPLLSPAARPIPFRLAGDHKILVRARFTDVAGGSAGEWLTLVFDTGATKSCLFEPALFDHHPGSRRWKSISGLVAPTLVGSTDARLSLVPAFELEGVELGDTVRRTRVDCAVITTELATALTAAVGEPVVGVVGYSFFKRDRLAIDYPNLTLWLEPNPRSVDEHPYEYSHVGIQLEREGGSVRVLGIVGGSPADSAGIAVGDTLVAIGTRGARAEELTRLTDLLEGAPGTRVRLTLRRDGVQRTYVLMRRKLL